MDEFDSLDMAILARNLFQAHWSPRNSSDADARDLARKCARASEVFYATLLAEQRVELACGECPDKAKALPECPFRPEQWVRLKDYPDQRFVFIRMDSRHDNVACEVTDGARTFWYCLDELEEAPEVEELAKPVEFKIGDRVMLKEPGDRPVPMTVAQVIRDGEAVACVYHTVVTSGLGRKVLHEMLTYYAPEELVHLTCQPTKEPQ